MNNVGILYVKWILDTINLRIEFKNGFHMVKIQGCLYLNCHGIVLLYGRGAGRKVVDDGAECAQRVYILPD